MATCMFGPRLHGSPAWAMLDHRHSPWLGKAWASLGVLSGNPHVKKQDHEPPQHMHIVMTKQAKARISYIYALCLFKESNQIKTRQWGKKETMHEYQPLHVMLLFTSVTCFILYLHTHTIYYADLNANFLRKSASRFICIFSIQQSTSHFILIQTQD